MASKYEQLVIDYKVLQEEAAGFKQNLEKERIKVNLLKADFNHAIEEEKQNKLNKEEELNRLILIRESTEMNLNQIISEQKIQFDSSITHLANELSQKNQEIITLKDLNSKFEKIIEELQMKNDGLHKEQLMSAEEFQKELAKVNKEQQDSREELVRLLEIGKDQIAKDEHDQNNLRSVSEEKERQYDFLLKEFESKMMIESKNLNELMVENKELNENLHDTELIISECQKRFSIKIKK